MPVGVAGAAAKIAGPLCRLGLAKRRGVDQEILVGMILISKLLSAITQPMFWLRLWQTALHDWLGLWVYGMTR
jgi:hypothetical protein